MKMKPTIFHMKSGNHSGRRNCGVLKETRSAFMRKDLLAIGLGLVLSSTTIFSSPAADGSVALKNHVPAAVKQGKVVARGRVPADTTLLLSLGLPLRNTDALSNFLAQIGDPKSPNFHHYLTPQEFTEHFGPTEDDYKAVIEFARKNNLKVAKTHANRMLLNVSGQAADVEKMFNVTLNEYQHPKENRQFFAPDREPSVPANLKLQDVQGLGDFNRSRPKLHINHVFSNQVFTATSAPIQKPLTQHSAADAGAKLGSGPAQTYMGDDFRRAYVPGTALTGVGQTVALYEADGYFASDIVAYENLTGRPNVPLQNILIDGFNGAPTGNGGEQEVSLDIEMIIAMAPNVSKILVYEGNDFLQNDILNQIAVDNAAKQIGCSWGWLGGPSLTTDQIFQQMAAQGQTFFDASGDIDAFLPGAVDDPSTFNAPSDNPYITQVGGTTLSMNGAGASYGSESVWNWGITEGLDGVGSSGGVSSFYSIPSWQTNINMPARGGSATKRNIPDVAMTADNVFIIADGGLGFSVGGTSVAAPLWAGLTALVNQQAALNSQSSVGFINPALYAIAQNPATYAASFNDITIGNNRWSASPTSFSASLGYDLCTGLGTPKSTNLINALIAFSTPTVHISPPPPPYGSTMASLNGGNPNGSWFMFIQDDAPISSGMIANGWILNLTTADLVGTAGDVELLVSSNSATAFVNQSTTFTVTVTNYGPSLSTNVIVTDNLPLGATVISTNATQGTISRTGTTLSWNVGNLALNAGAAMTVTVKSSTTGSVVNSASVNTGTPDPNPDDDTAFANVNFVPLSVSLTPAFSNGNFRISIPGPTNAGLTVILQANSNLVSTNWVNVYTGAPPINFVDPAPNGAQSRFYRAILVP
jgi:uncharacterized repeat protein (TIGR01451 family)